MFTWRTRVSRKPESTRVINDFIDLVGGMDDGGGTHESDGAALEACRGQAASHRAARGIPSGGARRPVPSGAALIRCQVLAKVALLAADLGGRTSKDDQRRQEGRMNLVRYAW